MLQKLVSSFLGCSASTRLTIFSSLGHNYDSYKAYNYNYNVDNLVCTLGLFKVSHDPLDPFKQVFHVKPVSSIRYNTFLNNVFFSFLNQSFKIQ